MQDDKHALHSQHSPSVADCGAEVGNPATDARFPRLEGVSCEELADMRTIMAALPGMSPRMGFPGQGPAGGQLHTLEARLGLLEESFARICTVVGRLEQEVLSLKGGADCD